MQSCKNRTLNLYLAMVLLSVVVTLGATPAVAGKCAQGYIYELSEGSYGTNDLMFKMNYTTTSPPNSYYGWMRFRSDLDAAKLRSIRAMAYMALANGNELEVWTTYDNGQGQSDCTRATELKLKALP